VTSKGDNPREVAQPACSRKALRVRLAAILTYRVAPYLPQVAKAVGLPPSEFLLLPGTDLRARSDRDDKGF
jgi:hypothetical protein